MIVYKNKEPVLRLNSRLIAQQGLTQAEVDHLKKLHLQRMEIEERLDAATDTKTIQEVFVEWTSNQFALQRGWGFPEDARYHPSHRLSKCSCPTADNDERIGTDYFITNEGCPIHAPQ